MGGAADKDLIPLFRLAVLFIWAPCLCTSICRLINKGSSPKSWSFTRSQKVTLKYMKTSAGCTCD